jgi:hypothetical protein
LWDAIDFFKSKEIDKNIMCAIHNNYQKNFNDFNDYLFEDIDKKELNEKLDILAKNLTFKQASWFDE